MAGVPVTEVAGRYGVSRQSVHSWLGATGARVRRAWRILALNCTGIRGRFRLNGIRNLLTNLPGFVEVLSTGLPLEVAYASLPLLSQPHLPRSLYFFSLSTAISWNSLCSSRLPLASTQMAARAVATIAAPYPR